MNETGKDWPPFLHIERACEVLDAAEAQLREDEWQMAAALAQVAAAHAAVAQAKMLGRGRAG